MEEMKEEMREGKKPYKVHSIKTMMLGILLACWLIPFVLVAGATVYYAVSSHFENRMDGLLTQLKFHDELSSERLNRVISEAKRISYEGEINREYSRYEEGEIGIRNLLRDGNIYLNQQYSTMDAMEFALLYFDKSPENYYCSTVNKSVGGNYQMISEYWEKDHTSVYGMADRLDTSVGFYTDGDRCYLVRNLLNNAYHRIGTLVILLNNEYCFGHIGSMAEDTCAAVQLNGMRLQIRGEAMSALELEKGFAKNGTGYIKEKGSLYLQDDRNNGSYEMQTFVRLDKRAVYTPLYGYLFVMAGMLILLVPLFLIVVFTFRRKIQEPVEKMMYGATRIEEGQLGFQLAGVEHTKEFQYLQDSFNKMSERLKYQFDHIYKEELALRDARIMALQSHINPHFMNNTLEIINWEARMSGADKVSEMISALATLMDATIDRKKRPEVPLSEEMQYVNAYFYITSERLGDRLVIRNDIPQSVMAYAVPRLILQPVIENAIEHGVVRRGTGTVTLCGKRERDFLYLDIINDAVGEEFDSEKIARLLSPDYDTSREPSGNMGIANVNQRLRILYGEPCGLSICLKDEAHVRARLTIFVGNRTRKDNK